MDNNDVVLTLPDSFFPLAKCICLEVREPIGAVTRFVNACFESEDTFDDVHDLVETPLEGSCDVFAYKESPSLGFYNLVLPNPLNNSHISPMCSLRSYFPKYYIDMPIDNSIIFSANVNLGYEDNMSCVLSGNVESFVYLGYFGGYDASRDPYCIYLVDMPRKTMRNTFFNFTFDFQRRLVY